MVKDSQKQSSMLWGDKHPSTIYSSHNMQKAIENGLAFEDTTTNCIFEESGNLWEGLLLDSECREATAEGGM